jgi:hypothetical protein
LGKNGFWHPCGVQLLLTPLPGVYACAPTHFLATLRVAVEFRDATRGQTGILDTLNKHPREERENIVATKDAK